MHTAYHLRLSPQPFHLYADNPSPVYGDMGGFLGESPIRVPLCIWNLYIIREDRNTSIPGNEKKRFAAHFAGTASIRRTGNGWTASVAASWQFPPSASHERNPGASGQQRHTRKPQHPAPSRPPPSCQPAGRSCRKHHTDGFQHSTLPNGYALVPGKPSSPWQTRAPGGHSADRSVTTQYSGKSHP